MQILQASERVLEADALLNEARQKVEEYRDTLDQTSYKTAQDWLKISKEFKAGMEGKDMFNRYKHALDYLNKAKETHQRIMQLTMGLYYQAK